MQTRTASTKYATWNTSQMHEELEWLLICRPDCTDDIAELQERLSGQHHVCCDCPQCRADGERKAS